MSILILSSHVHLSLPSGLLRSGFHTQTLHATPLSPRGVTRLAQLILLGSIVLCLLTLLTPGL